MAALDYPASPTVGQIYDRWEWDGTKWMLAASGGGGGGGSDGYSFVQEGAPTATVAGQTWYQTSTGASYVWYDSFWVQTSPGGVPAVPIAVWACQINDAGVLVQGGSGGSAAAPRYFDTQNGFRTSSAPIRANGAQGCVVDESGLYRVTWAIKYATCQYAFFGIEHVRAGASIAQYMTDIIITAAILGGQPGTSGKLSGYATRDRVVGVVAGDILRPIGWAPSFGYDWALITAGGGDSQMSVQRIGNTTEVSP